jgi:hypothetical protein
MTITVDDKLQCILREIAYRKHVYPNLVANKKMSQQKADREIKIMELIAADYRASARLSQPELFPDQAD